MDYVYGCLFGMRSLRASREHFMAAPQLPRFAVLCDLWPMFLIAVDARVHGGSCRIFPETLHTPSASPCPPASRTIVWG